MIFPDLIYDKSNPKVTHGIPIHSYLKNYPTFSKLVVFDEPRVYNKKEPYEDSIYFPKRERIKITNIALDDSLARTKRNIRDIVLCNEFDLFCTFTFNGDKKNTKKYGYTVHNRQNPDELKRVMSVWLKNQQNIHGSFRYIIVPEYHKDGQSIHFHALFKDYKGKLAFSGHLVNGRKSYNIIGYKAGHSSAVKIENGLDKVANYVGKYITKQMPQFGNKKRYWASKNLIRPLAEPNPQIDPFTRSEFRKTFRDLNKGFTLEHRDGKMPKQHNL